MPPIVQRERETETRTQHCDGCSDPLSVHLSHRPMIVFKRADNRLLTAVAEGPASRLVQAALLARNQHVTAYISWLLYQSQHSVQDSTARPTTPVRKVK